MVIEFCKNIFDLVNYIEIVSMCSKDKKIVKERKKIGYMKYRRIIGIIKIVPIDNDEIKKLFGIS